MTLFWFFIGSAATAFEVWLYAETHTSWALAGAVFCGICTLYQIAAMTRRR